MPPNPPHLTPAGALAITLDVLQMKITFLSPATKCICIISDIYSMCTLISPRETYDRYRQTECMFTQTQVYI